MMFACPEHEPNLQLVNLLFIYWSWSNCFFILLLDLVKHFVFILLFYIYFLELDKLFDFNLIFLLDLVELFVLFYIYFLELDKPFILFLSFYIYLLDLVKPFILILLFYIYFLELGKCWRSARLLHRRQSPSRNLAAIDTTDINNKA